MRLALIGDVHLYSVRLWPWDMLSKRVLGQSNLWMNRRKRFVLDRLKPLLDQIDQVRPDRLICTGDLTTTSLPGEFVMVQERMGEALDRYQAFVVPGNHDRYTWTAAWTDRFGRALDGSTSRTWPSWTDLGDGVAMVGLDAARPTFCTASGRLGEGQIERLVEMLKTSTFERLIVACHYPIAMPPGHAPEPWQHRLRDMDRLVEILGQIDRPVLYLHGHEHQPWCFRHPQAANVSVVNAGAPLMTDAPRWPNGQGFWVIDTTVGSLDNVSDGWGLWHQSVQGDDQWRVREISIPTETDVAADLS
jgi:3',5'-cyclic AMP phosphodiesterase CpdA